MVFRGPACYLGLKSGTIGKVGIGLGIGRPRASTRKGNTKYSLDPGTMNDLRILKSELEKRNKLQLADTTIFGTIGKGAFGRVRFVRLKETVFKTGPMRGERVGLALKMMNKVKAAQAMGGVHVAASAMKQEITLLKDLEFPFIVNLIAFFHDAKRVFIAMEYVNGGELFKLIYSGEVSRYLTAPVARQLFAEMTLTMEELHKHMIIYRDIKPENVLLDAQGHSKLVDFGLARRLDEFGRTRTNCGTLAYQAPEMLLNRSYGYSVDFWALGVVLFEMTLKKIPWATSNKGSANTTFVVSQAIMSLNIRWPWRMDAPTKFLIRKFLQHDEHKRYGSVKTGVENIKNSKYCVIEKISMM